MTVTLGLELSSYSGNEIKRAYHGKAVWIPILSPGEFDAVLAVLNGTSHDAMSWLDPKCLAEQSWNVSDAPSS